MLAEVLRHYHILRPNTPDMIELTDELVQDFELIPQGIPALYEYSERFARDRGRAKKLVNAFLNLTARHRGCVLASCLAPLILVLAYLSRPMISSMLSSVLQSISRILQGTTPRPYQPSYVTKATQTCTPIPDPSAESDSEQETVTFTLAEMVWLKSLTTDLLADQGESKIRQADMLTAIGDLEDENESLRDDVARLEMKIQQLEKQHALDENKQRKLHNERESYRLGGKDLKEKLEELQKEYNKLEDDRDEHGEMVKKLRDELEDMTVRRDELEQANGLLQIKNEELEGKAAIDKDAAAEYQETCEDLNKEVSRQERKPKKAAESFSQQEKELQEAAKETADLKAQLAAVTEASWKGLDDFESGLGTEEPKELGSAVQATGSQVGLKEDTSKSITQPMSIEQSKVEIRKLKKELDELEAVQKTPGASRNTWRGAIFEKPQGLSDNNVEEGAPLRRIQSAPLWLPLPHHDDDFDSLFDGSDFGDDNDHVLGDDNVKASDQYPNDENDHVSGDDNRDASGQDENNDDIDDRRHGGAEKVALKAYQTRQEQVGDTTPNDGQISAVPEPSPRRASPNLNVGAPPFIPTHRPTRPVPFRAMGPEDTKNPHIKKLNGELKRLTWTDKSDKSDMVEDKEGVAVAEEVIGKIVSRLPTQIRAI